MPAEYIYSCYFCDFCKIGCLNFKAATQHVCKGQYKRPTVTRGCFIDFEGVAGSGKAVQMNMLRDQLTNMNIKNEVYTFPNQITKTGRLCHKFIRNELSLDVEAAHRLFYDHFLEFDKEIRHKLSTGISIIVKNYSYSSMAHTCAKDKKLKDWVLELEENLMKPDICFLLKPEFPIVENVVGGVNIVSETHNMLEEFIKPKSFDRFAESTKWYGYPSGSYFNYRDLVKRFQNPGLIGFIRSRSELPRNNHLTLITGDMYMVNFQHNNYLDDLHYLKPSRDNTWDRDYIVWNYRASCLISSHGTNIDIHNRIKAPLCFYLYNNGIWKDIISRADLEYALEPMINHTKNRRKNAQTIDVKVGCDQPESAQLSSEKTDPDQSMCVICLEDNLDNVVWNCSHIFCENCSNKWLEQNAHNPTCPICRTAYIYYTKLTLN